MKTWVEPVLLRYGITVEEFDAIRLSEHRFKLIDDLERKHPGFTADFSQAFFDAGMVPMQLPEQKPVTRIR